MKHFTLVCVLSSMCFVVPATVAQNTQPQNVVALQSVVSQIQQALANVQTTLANNQLPPLKQVKLSLQTIATKKGGVTLKLWVITIGGTWEKDKSQQVDIVLTPPSPGAPLNVATQSLTQELQDAIVTTAQGVKNAGSGAVPLKLDSLDVQLGFTVKGDVQGGANIQIVPVTAEFSGDLSKTAVQQLTVSYATPAKKQP